MKDMPSTPDVDLSADESSMALERGSYSSLSLDNGDYVIYDRDETDAWLQSDLAVDVTV